MKEDTQKECAEKNSFFSILNKAISSPSSLQKPPQSDDYSEKQTRSHKTVSALEKRNDKSHE